MLNMRAAASHHRERTGGAPQRLRHGVRPWEPRPTPCAMGATLTPYTMGRPAGPHTAPSNVEHPTRMDDTLRMHGTRRQMPPAKHRIAPSITLRVPLSRPTTPHSTTPAACRPSPRPRRHRTRARRMWPPISCPTSTRHRDPHRGHGATSGRGPRDEAALCPRHAPTGPPSQYLQLACSTQPRPVRRNGRPVPMPRKPPLPTHPCDTARPSAERIVSQRQRYADKPLQVHGDPHHRYRSARHRRCPARHGRAHDRSCQDEAGTCRGRAPPTPPGAGTTRYRRRNPR